MSLRARFSLWLVVAFVIGLGLSAFVGQRVLLANARRETVETARLMIESAASIRKYTSAELQPLLMPSLAKSFHPQSIPSYSANQLFTSLRASRPEFTYREATLNPTNLADKASDWEADVVQHFRNEKDAKETIGERVGATETLLFVARPLRIKDQACLQCHGNPADVPNTVAALYGRENGTNWKLGDTVGAQIALVPTTVPEARAQQELWTFVGMQALVFATLLACVNLMLDRWVVGPVRRMAEVAEAISTGSGDAPEISADGGGEIGMLAASFNRMARSLKRAMEMINRG